MCLPADRLSLLMWLRTQVSVIQAWRDAALLEGTDDSELCSLLSAHHGWLVNVLTTLGDTMDSPCSPVRDGAGQTVMPGCNMTDPTLTGRLQAVRS